MFLEPPRGYRELLIDTARRGDIINDLRKRGYLREGEETEFFLGCSSDSAQRDDHAQPHEVRVAFRGDFQRMNSTTLRFASTIVAACPFK